MPQICMMVQVFSVASFLELASPFVRQLKILYPQAKLLPPSENLKILIVIYIEDRLVVKFFFFVKLYG